MACFPISILLTLAMMVSAKIPHAPAPTTPEDAKALRYRVVDIGILRDCDQIVVAGLSNQGQVTGYCYTHVPPGHGNDLFGHAFCWFAGNMVGLPGLGGKFSHALAINGEGDIVGDADTASNQTLPALWRHSKEGSKKSKLLPLSKKGGVAWAIAENGHILVNASPSFVYMYPDGKVTSLQNLPADGRLRGINSQDEIVGYTAVINGPGFSEGNNKGFVWRKGRWHTLPTLGGKQSVCWNINDSGTIIGWAETQTGERHACYWENDQIHDLGVDDRDSEANGLNAQGSIVGRRFRDPRQGEGACLWQQGASVDLNSCIPTDPGWVLRSADRINTKGEIAGTGSYKGQGHAFLLRPVSTLQARPSK